MTWIPLAIVGFIFASCFEYEDISKTAPDIPADIRRTASFFYGLLLANVILFIHSIAP